LLMLAAPLTLFWLGDWSDEFGATALLNNLLRRLTFFIKFPAECVNENETPVSRN